MYDTDNSLITEFSTELLFLRERNLMKTIDDKMDELEEIRIEILQRISKDVH